MPESTGVIAAANHEVYGPEALWGQLLQNNRWNGGGTDRPWGLQEGKGSLHYPAVGFRFNPTPAIPAGATITSAVVKGQCSQAGVGAFNTEIRVLKQDGGWEQDNSADQWRPGGNTVIQPVDFPAQIFNTSAGSLGGTVPTVTEAFPMRNPSMGGIKKFGQSIVVVGGGTLGSAQIRCSKFGTLTGNVWCEIVGFNISGKPETILATSDTIPANSLPTGSTTSTTFTFSGAEQITLNHAQFVVVTLVGDTMYTGVNVVNVWVGTSNYVFGNPYAYGSDTAWGPSHYPFKADYWENIPTHGQVIWATPDMILGVVYTTNDISVPIQTYVDSAEYSEGDPFGILLFANTTGLDAGDVRYWARYGHPTYPLWTRLVINWEHPDIPDVLPLVPALQSPVLLGARLQSPVEQGIRAQSPTRVRARLESATALGVRARSPVQLSARLPSLF
jgi:hypothetical protein